MTLGAKVARLERSRRDAPPAPCRECGAPAGWVPSLTVKNEQGVELLPTCPRCAFPLNASGRAMTPLPPGSEQKVLIMDELPPV